MRLIATLIIPMISVASTAQAATLATPSLPADMRSEGRSTECVARNLSNATLEVSIEGYGASGTRMAALTMDVPARSTRKVSPPETPNGIPTFAWCRFVVAGRNSKLEGSIRASDGDGGRVLMSLPAR